MPEFCKHHIHESMYCGSCYKEALKNANARIAELEAEVTRVTNLLSLKALELDKAEKIVEFYGAKENWRDEADSGVKVFGPFKDHKTWTDCGYEYDWENLHDQGDTARKWLEENK